MTEKKSKAATVGGFTCRHCRTVSPTKPRDWKETAPGLVCGDCLPKHYRMLSVTIPVSRPLGEDADGRPWTWESFRPVVRTAFKASTDLANWAVHHLYRRDDIGIEETPDAVKMGAKAEKGKCYLYGTASAEYPKWAAWAGAAINAQTVLRTVHQKYLRDRFATVVRHSSKLVHYRYPYPYPVHNQSWSTGYRASAPNPDYSPDGDRRKRVWVASDSPTAFPVVNVTLPGVGGVTLCLKRKRDFRRQLALFRKLHDGVVVKGSASLRENRKGQTLVKLSGWFPREVTDAKHACLIRTDPRAFMVAEVDGRKPWLLNCDHLRRLCAHGGPSAALEVSDTLRVNKAYGQRVSEDNKREKRQSRSQRRSLATYREGRSEKYRNRTTTAIQQIVAQVRRFAQRQGVVVVVYDDSVRSYLPESFAWAAMRTRLVTALDGAGVTVISADTMHPEEKEEWSKTPTLATALAIAGRRLVAGCRRRGPHPKVTTIPTSKRKPRNS
jgi:hypothetical protein